MAKATASVAAMVVLVAAAAGGRIDAAPLAGQDAALVAGQVVVVHVTDYRRIAPRDLGSAEQLAAQVYRAIGVQVIWVDDQVETAQPEGAFHAQVVLLSRAMTAMKCQQDGVSGNAFGVATKASRRASIFYDRIADHAANTQTVVSRPLGLVLAHEIGHLLLPAYSHSRVGIMRAAWDGPMLLVPNFTNDQGAAIRGLLTAVHAN